MEQILAEKLVDELNKHPQIIEPNKKKFTDLLVSVDIPESKRFYEDLPENSQLSTGTSLDSYHYLSLNKVLRNKNAKDYFLSKFRQKYESWASIYGISSSNILTKLRMNTDLMVMIATCEHPFSLLGELETHDSEDTLDRHLFVIKRPILVVPKTKNMEKILEWENKNTIYHKEVGFTPFRHLKRISRAKYLSY